MLTPVSRRWQRRAVGNHGAVHIAAHRRVARCRDAIVAPCPSERQRMRGPTTSTCPSGDAPITLPISRTRWSRERIGSAGRRGRPGRQPPSISRAAIPASRTCRPSAHQVGPSPSQTRTGVQENVCPAGAIIAAASRRACSSKERDRAHDDAGPGDHQVRIEKNALQGRGSLASRHVRSSSPGLGFSRLDPGHARPVDDQPIVASVDERQGLVGSPVEPEFPVFGPQDHRHAVVHV